MFLKYYTHILFDLTQKRSVNLHCFKVEVLAYLNDETGKPTLC